MEEVLIKVYPTYISFRISPEGIIEGTNFNIRYYLKRFIQRKYNHRNKYWELEFLYASFNKAEKSCRLPRHNLDHLITTLNTYNILTKVEYVNIYEGKSVKIPLDNKYKPRNQLQLDNIDFLTDTSKSMRALAANTGTGKTFCAIQSIAKLGKVGIIFVQGLLEQWINEIYKFTKLREGEVYLIQGQQSLGRLNKNIPHPRPKIYVASIGTMRKYVLANTHPYTEFKPFNDFLKYLGIGTKVTDECHLNFSTNTMIDLNCTIQNNIYLSATYSRSDIDGKRIFDIVFPPEVKFGEGQYKKYTNIYSYSYYLGYIPERVGMTPNGYNQPKYEKYLIRKKSKLNGYLEKIRMLTESHYINIKRPGQKLLILIGTKNMANVVKDNLIKYYGKDLVISTYFADTEDEVLRNSDIIVSTTGSCGVGKDIAHLRTVILTNSFSSWSLCKQVLGRLRELKNGDSPEFVYIANSAMRSHMDHRYVRRNIYQPLAAKYLEMDI